MYSEKPLQFSWKFLLQCSIIKALHKSSSFAKYSRKGSFEAAKYLFLKLMHFSKQISFILVQLYCFVPYFNQLTNKPALSAYTMIFFHFLHCDCLHLRFSTFCENAQGSFPNHVRGSWNFLFLKPTKLFQDWEPDSSKCFEIILL